MDDPVKIIYKYKNNNKRIQYHVYIFIGNVSKKVERALDSITELSFLETLEKISDNDLKALVDYYGEYWYKKIFISYHLTNIIAQVNRDTDSIKKITKRYGDEWVNKHIKNFNLIDEKLYFSYDSIIKMDNMRKIIKTKRKYEEDTGEQDIDYHVMKGGKFYPLKGGDDDTLPIEEDNQEHNVVDDDDFIPEDDDLNLEEIEKIYSNIDVVEDEDVKKTTKLIKSVMNDENIFKKTKKNMVDFDISKDNSTYDEKLKNVYVKKYVYQNYIFHDDNIKAVKSKVCASIKNNPKFSEQNSYFPPTRQFMWTEYLFNDEIKQVMMGLKWIKRTDLLQIDIEPNNNIRIYEELRGNLKYLKENIRRYGSKIKWEDDDYNILYDYHSFMTNNEVFMIDIYNEFGKNYNPDQEALKNIVDVYVKIYFPKITSDDIANIIGYLNDTSNVEQNKNITIYESISSDLLIENEIVQELETVKIPNRDKIFHTNYIAQSVIHLTLRLSDPTQQISLFRIFNEFKLTDEYPLIRYMMPNQQILYKYNEKELHKFADNKNNIDVLTKWFENTTYGISFKLKFVEKGIEKYMGVNLDETGKINYKTNWKESEKATFDDMKQTYNYIRDFIKKINGENNRVNFEIPHDQEFKFAFINSIQQFVIPERYTINHNDFSDFARLFYPYVALVIEPRKRKSKTGVSEDVSKYGTYLRYKKISKYENIAKIEQRIVYLIRNFEHTDMTLANEIAKQFNVTIDIALSEVEKVKTKFPHLKKSRKILKKLENLPKYKPPGIGIEIQGKEIDNYKIRISGARNKQQLQRITDVVNILLYLYMETYIFKRPELQKLLKHLEKLTNIAKRRQKVVDYVQYEEDTNDVKLMASLDKDRIGFKPDKNQNPWTRSCQNSGNDKKRRPQQFLSLDEVIKAGFVYNPTTKTYEKQIKYKDGDKMKTTVIRTVALGDGENSVYYSCNPKDNAGHMYIGFLGKSNNPNGLCMPCCFIKDQVTSVNLEKKDYFMKCIGNEAMAVDMTDDKLKKRKKSADQIYILQDTNKIQDGKIGMLSKYLDFFLNISMNKMKNIDQHFLRQTKNGYFFKYGVRQDKDPFLHSVGAALNISVEKIKEIMVDKIKNDSFDVLFTALNNGDIKSMFKTKEKLIHYIENGNLDYETFNHFLSIPNILDKDGVNIFVFEKITTKISETLEKEKQLDDYIMLCMNNEEIDNLSNLNRKNIILTREYKNYYPIVLLDKEDINGPVSMHFSFNYNDDIIKHINEFYLYNCKDYILGVDTTKKRAKYIYKQLVGIKDPDYKPKYQIIDARNKCKYIITENLTIIPTIPSGAVINLRITKTFENKLLSFDELYENLMKLTKLIDIRVKPIGVYFTNKTKDTMTIVALMTEERVNIPIREEVINISKINDMGLLYENQPLFDKVDEEIIKGRENFSYDDRIKKVNEFKYYDESYELMRLEFSEYLFKNPEIKGKILRILENKKIDRNDKKMKIKQIVYRIIDKNLYHKLIELYGKQTGGKYDRLVYITNRPPETKDYKINNNRELCNINTSRESCNNKYHCQWFNDECYFAITREMAIEFANRLTSELVTGDLKGQELLRMNNYYVSDIVDFSQYKEMEGVRIIKSTNTAINKLLAELFEGEELPVIGRKKYNRDDIDEIAEMNKKYPLEKFATFYIQPILNNNMTIFRAIANGISWIKNKYFSTETRNLGYYSEIQTDLANFLKSLVIDWLNINDNHKEVEFLLPLLDYNNLEDMMKYYINILSKQDVDNTACLLESYILNKLIGVPIVLYDDDEINYIFDNGLVYKRGDDENIMKKYKNRLSECVTIRFELMEDHKIPNRMDVIYYL